MAPGPSDAGSSSVPGTPTPPAPVGGIGSAASLKLVGNSMLTGVSARDAVKDLRLAVEIYKRAGAATPITSTTKKLYEAAARSAGDLDMSAIATLYEGQPATRGGGH